MLDRLMDYGERDKGPDTALITSIFLFSSLAFISLSGVIGDHQSQEQVAESTLVSDEALLFFRFFCAGLSLVTLAWVAIDPKGSHDYPLYFEERVVRRRDVSGPTRLAPYTMWHFALFGFSFAVSAFASWINISGGVVPEWALVASPVLFASSYTCALLVTCVISFHIIWDEIGKGHSVNHLFKWYELVMHNANVALLGIALVINGMDVDWRYFAFPIVFGVAYVAWAAVYANFISGVFIYDFMDYRKRGAPLIYLALLVVQTSFFGLVIFLDRLSEWSPAAGATAILLITASITTLSEPEQPDGND